MYKPNPQRYDAMLYNRCGKSGLKLPAVSLGLWQNFGDQTSLVNARKMLHTAFDLGITHFDLANNYGPPPGSAELNFGKLLAQDFASYRDELVISTKAGYLMGPGPYGEWGSRKYLLSSLDASLKRMGLEYVDIFYSHRFDPDTPLEETMGALAQLVRQGKALYVGISNYHRAEAVKAIALLKELGCPCVLNQVRYSLLDRWVEDDYLLDGMKGEAGAICFSPLAQGLLSDRYLEGTIPPDSRASKSHFLKPETITKERVQLLNGLNAIARKRGQSLSEMAISWLLVDKRVTSVLIGASSAEQVKVNLKAVGKSPDFSQEELSSIDELCRLWK